MARPDAIQLRGLRLHPNHASDRWFPTGHDPSARRDGLQRRFGRHDCGAAERRGARQDHSRKSECEGGGGIPRAGSSSGARESSRCSVEGGDLGCHRPAVVQSATPAKGARPSRRCHCRSRLPRRYVRPTRHARLRRCRTRSRPGSSGRRSGSPPPDNGSVDPCRSPA